MNDKRCRKIKFYLHNYYNIDKLIEERKECIIESINPTSRTWLMNGNTLENQTIKLIEDWKIIEYKRWQVFLKEILVFLCNKNFLLYNIAVLYYMENENLEYILKTLKIDLKDFILLDKKLISLIYKNAEIRCGKKSESAAAWKFS